MVVVAQQVAAQRHTDQVPDIHYVERDGGPWKVCEELKLDPRVEFVEKADRCVVFKRIDDE